MLVMKLSFWCWVVAVAWFAFLAGVIGFTAGLGAWMWLVLAAGRG
jgi:hypothetical protein